MYQQGDVLIKNADIPKTAKLLNSNNGKYVLAEGEATGHSHAVKECDGVELLELNGVLYVKATSPFVIEHEEHKPIEIPAGEWEINIVQEYDHFAEEARRVQD